jgi:hypothetical protein
MDAAQVDGNRKLVLGVVWQCWRQHMVNFLQQVKGATVPFIPAALLRCGCGVHFLCASFLEFFSAEMGGSSSSAASTATAGGGRSKASAAHDAELDVMLVRWANEVAAKSERKRPRPISSFSDGQLGTTAMLADCFSASVRVCPQAIRCFCWTS